MRLSRTRSMPAAAPVAGWLVLCAAAALGAACSRSPSPAALELRNRGLAQLENDQPEEAAASFRALIKEAPDDPLGYANLAVCLLRQRNGAEALPWIEQALRRAPGRPDLLALQGEVLRELDRTEEALAAYRRAAAAAPDEVEIQYALLEQAGALAGRAAAKARSEAIQALLRLRPENLVVLLRAGESAIAAGDRAAATGAYLRLRELVWQPEPEVAASLASVLEALAAGGTAAARIPALRLDNQLKPLPLYRQGLRALSPVQAGVPVGRFSREPPAESFGEPEVVSYRAAALATTPTVGGGLAVGDFAGGGRMDIARLGAGDPPRLELRCAARGWQLCLSLPAVGISGLTPVDLDNDGHLDLIGSGARRIVFWRGRGDGTFEDATAAWVPAAAGAESVAPVDYDLEGDLDLALAGGGAGAGELLRNALAPPLVATGGEGLPPAAAPAAAGMRQIIASDLDRDGYPDLLVAGPAGLRLLSNRGQGRFTDRTAAAGLSASGPWAAVASADLDNDGLPDLLTVGGDGRLAAWRNRNGRFTRWRLRGLDGRGGYSSVLAFDADNDGRLDVAAAGADGVLVLGQRPATGEPTFAPLPVAGAPRALSAVAAADLAGRGHLDLVVAGGSGLYRLQSSGGHNHWLAVRLRAQVVGSSKNNLHGIGSTLEVRAGGAYQFREATGQVTHLGLGDRRAADLLRVVWTNGVPQDRLDVQGDAPVVETQVLKGSCPFLYAWNGRGYGFVTDLLWAAPIGMPMRPGLWAGADPAELVRVDGLRLRGEAYELRLTEELWEAAFFDAVRLWVVDHPADIEVASNLRVLPGRRVPPRVLASRGLRPVVAAWDGRGREVTGRVRQRDEIYAAGYSPSPYQGVASEPWTTTFDLGAAPGGPIRLHLDGWTFPADASLNLAVAQRPDLAVVAPRLEVETAAGWHTLLPELGTPAGKTKTLVVDTPPLPPRAHRLRIVTSLWLAWDRIAWTASPADAAPLVRARLAPQRADLHYRGFSALLRAAPDAPHSFDYSRVTRRSPWLPFPGRYTRYGDVRELLLAADDRSAILGPGDELALRFDARGLPPPPAGFSRTLFLESHGWDKDADRNTYAGRQLEPLPFRAMSGYPYGPGEAYPDTPALRDYRVRWLTREVAVSPPGAMGYNPSPQ